MVSIFDIAQNQLVQPSKVVYYPKAYTYYQFVIYLLFQIKYYYLKRGKYSNQFTEAAKSKLHIESMK